MPRLQQPLRFNDCMAEQVYKDHSLYMAQSNLWTLPQTDCIGIEQLKSIANAINNGSTDRLPSLLLIGNGKDFTAQCFVNSINSSDIRICKYHHLECGTQSFNFFDFSMPHTAHIIEDLDKNKKIGEANLWKYLTLGACPYFFRGREATIIHCNGIIILTAYHINHISEPIAKATDYIIYLKPHNKDYYDKVVRQYLTFCGIEYKQDIVSHITSDKTSIRSIIQVVKTCLTLLKSEMTNNLTISLVNKAIGIEEHNNSIYTDEIPF